VSKSEARSQNAKPGLADWMQDVLKQVDRAADGFHADPVHDLRVAIRRCRSIAEGLRAIDPDPRWKKMRRSAKELFASLGRLRDAQVMMEWIGKLALPEDPAAKMLIAYCQAQEQSFKQEAALLIDAFDRKQWQSWVKVLPRRAAQVQSETEAFQALALERWTQARRLHNLAMRTRRDTTLHRLRIGVKKFRYVVENLLPELHQQWSEGLKHFQDVLGEIQDLSVLWDAAIRIGALADPETRERWERLVLSEREARIEHYRRETAGSASLWQTWRSGLPRGQAARTAALKKLKVWASFLDPDVRHSQRVTRLALQIHQGLVREGLLGVDPKRSQELLLAATSVIGVGRSGRGKDRPKVGERMVQTVERPFAWKRQDLAVIAAIARFHRGALPGKGHASLRRFPRAIQRLVQRLSGIVRLANALDIAHDRSVRRVTLSRPGDFLVVWAEGLDPQSEMAEKVAGARYLLELSLGMPVFVRPRVGYKSLKINMLKSIKNRRITARTR
jgi:CHAD domain-containing protein